MNHEQYLISQATELAPLLERNASRTESDRRIAEENIRALERAGLMDLLIPKRLGGQGVTMKTSLAISAALAKACPSTSWVQTLMNVSAWFATRASHRVQEEIFGQPGRPRLCGSLAPNKIIQRVEGGYLISGEWDFTSGCWHSN
jgi:3-hydroxy-9,10-secoandrosta-1,3,5(10)-triene-9,17-dione monooxygenase